MLPRDEKQHPTDIGKICNEQLVEFQLNKAKSEKWFNPSLA